MTGDMWEGTIQKGDYEYNLFPLTKEGFHDAIEYLAHKLIPNLYPRHKHIDAMRNHHDWKYSGNL